MAGQMIAAKRIGPEKMKLVDIPTLEREVRRTLDNAQRDTKANYRKPVAEWSGKPEFQSQYKTTGDSRSVWIYPAGKYKMKFIWVDKGVVKGKYIIRPKNVPYMRFWRGYSASTKRRSLSSSKARRFAPFVVTNKPIKNWGIEAREFTETVVEVVAPSFYQNVNNAIDRAIAAART